MAEYSAFNGEMAVPTADCVIEKLTTIGPGVVCTEAGDNFRRDFLGK